LTLAAAITAERALGQPSILPLHDCVFREATTVCASQRADGVGHDVAICFDCRRQACCAGYRESSTLNVERVCEAGAQQCDVSRDVRQLRSDAKKVPAPRVRNQYPIRISDTLGLAARISGSAELYSLSAGSPAIVSAGTFGSARRLSPDLQPPGKLARTPPSQSLTLATPSLSKPLTLKGL